MLHKLVDVLLGVVVIALGVIFLTLAFGDPTTWGMTP